MPRFLSNDRKHVRNPPAFPPAPAPAGETAVPASPTVGWLCLLQKVFSKAFLVASNMDSDRTFNSCSWPMEEGAALKNACTSSDWTREEDKAFENALLNYYNDANLWDKIALAVPGKTIEDLKMHYEAFIDDVGLDVIDQKDRPSPKHGVQTRGIPWTEEEHRQSLYGLQRFGKGDWKSISRYSVPTKSNSQVASHAQKFFKRLSSSKEGKRLSINDIRTLNPETLLALEKATKNCMPVRCKDKSTNAGRTEEPLPGCLEKASKHAENQLLPECPSKSSADSGKQRMPRWPKRASTADGNKLLPRYPSGAPRSTGKKLLLESPRKLQLIRGIICSLGTQREQEVKLGTNCFLLHLLLARLMAPDSLARRLELMPGTSPTMFQSKQPDLFPPMHR